MNIQIGNFSSLYEVGVALNLSFSLFKQVRSIGRKRAEQYVDQRIDNWVKEANSLERDRGAIDKDHIVNTKKYARKQIAKTRKRARAVSENWTKTCALAASAGIAMLLYCALYGQDECVLSLHQPWQWPVPFFAVAFCCFTPLALFHIRWIWKRGEDELNLLIKMNHRAWNAGHSARDAVDDLDNSV